MVALKSNKTKQKGSLPKIPRSDKRLFNKIRLEIKGSEKEVLILHTILRLVEDLENSDIWFSLGEILSDIDRYDCADKVFDRVVALDPNHNKAWRAKALALGMLHRGDEAAECYKRSMGAIKAKPEDFKELNELAEYIDELVMETENRSDMLDIENLNDEDIIIIEPDTENMEGFIAELLNYIARDQNEAKHLLSKLDIPKDSNKNNGVRK
jgi:tetratricopeptide (TPR) repeat protein